MAAWPRLPDHCLISDFLTVLSVLLTILVMLILTTYILSSSQEGIVSQSVSLTQYVILSVRPSVRLPVPVSLLSKCLNDQAHLA